MGFGVWRSWKRPDVAKIAITRGYEGSVKIGWIYRIVNFRSLTVVFDNVGASRRFRFLPHRLRIPPVSPAFRQHPNRLVAGGGAVGYGFRHRVIFFPDNFASNETPLRLRS